MSSTGMYPYKNKYLKKVIAEESETEKFILEVQKRECIWNVNSKSYNLKCVRNREVRRRAWEEIAEVFNHDWDRLSCDDKHKKVETLSRKWANIRQYYIHECRKPPSDSPPKKKQRRYHHLLSFLDNAVLKRRPPRIKVLKDVEPEKPETSDSESGELLIIEDDEELQRLSDKYENAVEHPKELDAKPNPEPNISNQGNAQNWDTPVNLTTANIEKKPAKKNQIAKKNPEIMKLLNENRGPPPITPNSLISSICQSAKPAPNFISSLNKASSLDQTAEASKRFLLSLLPEIMSLNVKQNLQFRLGIMDLLNDIKMRVKPNTKNN